MAKVGDIRFLGRSSSGDIIAEKITKVRLSKGRKLYTTKLMTIRRRK